MKNRTELAKHFNELGFKIGAEVGVAQGYYSEVLCKAIPGLKLYCIDPWLRYRDYGDFAKRSTFLSMEAEAREKLKPYGCIIMNKFSVDAEKSFTEGMLDFVFIDANHSYEYVKQDIELWTPKVRKGGIVSGHDYYKTKAGNVGVIQAVDEYVKEHGYKLELTDWATQVPKDDRQPCFYFTV
jgi:predicted O-methyltransferase YrrM